MSFAYQCIIGDLYSAKQNIQHNLNFNDIFMSTCIANQLHIVKWMIYNNDIPITNNTYIEAFIKCCINGNLPVAKLLYENVSIKINIVEHSFVSSCESNQINIAKWLLTIIIQKNTNNMNCCIRLFCSVKYNCDDVIIYNAFVRACTNGHLEIAKWLFNKYTNINISSETYINICITTDNIAMILWLTSIYDHDIHIQNDIIFIRACDDNKLDLVASIYFNDNVIRDKINDNVEELRIKIRDTFTKSINNENGLDKNIYMIYLVELQSASSEICDHFANICIDLYEKNNIQLLESLLESTHQIHTNIIYTFYINACVQNKCEIVRWLLTRCTGLDIHLDSNENFIKMCNLGHLSIVKLLLETEASLTYTFMNNEGKGKGKSSYNITQKYLSHEVNNYFDELSKSSLYYALKNNTVINTDDNNDDDIHCNICDIDIYTDNNFLINLGCFKDHNYCKSCYMKCYKTPEMCLYCYNVIDVNKCKIVTSKQNNCIGTIII